MMKLCKFVARSTHYIPPPAPDIIHVTVELRQQATSCHLWVVVVAVVVVVVIVVVVVVVCSELTWPQILISGGWWW